jgi:HD-like signal output (HDOD) protein
VVSIFIGVFLLIAGVCVYLFQKQAQSKDQNKESVSPTARPSVAPTQHVHSSVRRQMPGVLKDFRFASQTELAPEKIQDIIVKLRLVPRPPSGLRKLVSDEFLAKVTSADLCEIVMSEPEVAVKVLAIANSPLYGLQQLVGDIDEAVKFLGVNKVRGICLQYMLNDSFSASSPAMNEVYARVWNESALAGELCFKIAQLLELEQPGTFITQVVLSCLGRLATYSLMDPIDVLSMSSKGLLERSKLEQKRLGLASGEIGGLLMQDWALPNRIINIVKEIDVTMVTPVSRTSTSRRTRHALCYLCSQIAEGLVSGEIADLSTFDIAKQDSAEYFHIHAYLELADLARVTELIRMPEVTSSISRMMKAMQAQQ